MADCEVKTGARDRPVYRCRGRAGGTDESATQWGATSRQSRTYTGIDQNLVFA